MTATRVDVELDQLWEQRSRWLAETTGPTPGEDHDRTRG